MPRQVLLGILLTVSIALAMAPWTARQAHGQAGSRIIPYDGLLELNGTAVNAEDVDFNFALFPCAEPDGSPGCQPVWVAAGTWNAGANPVSTGWPSSRVPLSVSSGRFAAALGGPGMNPVTEAVFLEPELYAAVIVESTALSGLQRIDPAAAAVRADRANDFDVQGDLSVGGTLQVAGTTTLGVLSTGAISTETLTASSATLDGAAIEGDLDVAGALTLGGRTVGRITSCAYSGLPTLVSASHYIHLWTAEECDNGLPSGSCLGFISRAAHGGPDQDWTSLNPGELSSHTPPQSAPNGGMDWWCTGCDAHLTNIRAIYLCEE